MTHTQIGGTAVVAALAVSMGSAPAAAQPPEANAAPAVRLNQAQQHLATNTSLRLKVQSRLPGRDVIAAASGFRNLGQFVAAVNVSYNTPGVRFRSLKTLMTGETPMGLGQALQQLKGLDPATTATTANTALAQADAEILATSSWARRTKSKTKS